MSGRRMARIGLISTALILLLPTPAPAHIDSFEINGIGLFCGDPPACNDVFYVDTEGEVVCDKGEGFVVVARVTDESYTGKGRTRGRCAGPDPVRWVVVFETPGPVGPDVCWELLSARVQTKRNGELHDSARTSLPCT